MFELVDKYPEIQITVKAGELKEWAEYIIKLAHQELVHQVANVNGETYLSRNEVAEMLRVDKSTLWRWAKRDYLKPIEVGGKRRYRMSDVKRILNLN